MHRIRPLRTIAEYHACERLQQRVWQFADREIIPSNELITIAHNGGCVIGAFSGRRMVGFCFGFPAWRNGETYHCSRMLAILPGLRDRGLGFRLKCAQRAFVLRQGLKRIRWTFDPLQARNAFFNIEKLGCTASEYSVDHYGPSTAIFNRGLPTDRLIADWEIGSARVVAALRRTRRAGGVPVRRPPTGTLRCEIPPNIEVLQRSALPLARRWRLRVRRALRLAFRRGFEITGVSRRPDGDGRRCAYLLSRRDLHR
ncbi:MAG: GNAT family N-acetyltransferase [Planctomycetes bacterium]|nr:GNAT family N-acetyltransferase [Planctomycetota bacterium]